MGAIGGRVLTTAALGCTLAADAAPVVRGVAPEEQGRYAGTEFRCLSADAGSSHPGDVLPSSAVNDDFCDCADGSDEPGTSACAGQQKTLFYCPNEQSVPSYVYTSRVNDGICDCCDGSDEWQVASRCANTCSVEGRELARERSKKEADLKSGVQQRRALIDSGKKLIVQAGRALQELEQKLPTLEKAEQDAKEKLEAAKAKVGEQEEKAAESTAQATTATTTSATETTTQAPAAPVPVASDGEKEAKPEAAAGQKPVSEYAKWMEGGDKAAGAAAATEEKPQVSEYTKWMDGADKVLEETATTTAAPEDDTDWGDEDNAEFGGNDHVEPIKEKPKPTKKGWGQKFLDGWVDAWLGVKGTATGAWDKAFGWLKKTPEQRQLDAAQRALNDAQKSVADSKSRMEELRKQTAQEIDEGWLAFSDLNEQCVEKKFEEYKYKICFFKDAKQDSTSIGKYNKWESWNVALFDKGQYCPGGPHRSFRAKFQCGQRLELLDIEEPSRCAYEGTVTHPGACTEALLEASQKPGPRRPTDEL